jgi:hypothetical protein
MSDLLLVAPESTESVAGHSQLTEAQVLLKPMVLDSVTVNHTLGRVLRRTTHGPVLGWVP